MADTTRVISMRVPFKGLSFQDFPWRSGAEEIDMPFSVFSVVLGVEVYCVAVCSASHRHGSCALAYWILCSSEANLHVVQIIPLYTWMNACAPMFSRNMSVNGVGILGQGPILLVGLRHYVDAKSERTFWGQSFSALKPNLPRWLLLRMLN